MEFITGQSGERQFDLFYRLKRFVSEIYHRLGRGQTKLGDLALAQYTVSPQSLRNDLRCSGRSPRAYPRRNAGRPRFAPKRTERNRDRGPGPAMRALSLIWATFSLCSQLARDRFLDQLKPPGSKGFRRRLFSLDDPFA